MRLNKLKKKGWALEQIIIVDDSPEKSHCNDGNVVHIIEIICQPADTELIYLQQYLLTLNTVSNIRSIEK